jgi:hypothetical protein
VSASAIIDAAAAEGVALSLTPSGEVKVAGS